MMNSLLKMCDVVVVVEWLGVTRLATVVVIDCYFISDMKGERDLPNCGLHPKA